ncbi:hypothetical protein ABEZ86_00005 [Micromonospora provocatoris]
MKFYIGDNKVKKEGKSKKKNQSILKDILVEILDSTLFEAVWIVLSFIPRMIMGIFRNLI